MSTTQLLSNLLLCLSLIFQCSFAVSPCGKIIPRIPSPLIHPENSQPSLSNDQSSNSGLYETRYFTQTLNHFGFHPKSYQTFQQKYLINSTFWGGPRRNALIFVYTGNEGDIEWFAQNTGFMFETAPRFNAVLVFIKHRYYGKSIPFGGNKELASSNTSTLGYLSSMQALVDYATLITDLKKNLTAEHSPVAVFGGSYGGMLAAWFRLKYPHIAIGALSSSSPILNFVNITSPYSFIDIVTRDFRSKSKNCYKVIKRSWQKIDDTAKQQGGLEILRKSFRLCKNSMDADYLKGWLETALVYTAMTDYPTPSNFLNHLPAYPVKQMCRSADDPSKEDDDFSKLYCAADIYFNYSDSVSCLDLMDDSNPHGIDGWAEQLPTLHLTSASSLGPPGSLPSLAAMWVTGIPSFCAWCNFIQEQEIRRILRRFGSNIIFYNGLRDPWSGGRVLKSISKSIVAIVAKKDQLTLSETSHK